MSQRLALFLGLSFLFSGCVTWNEMLSGESHPSGGFRSSIAVKNKVTPLPVELAEDIEPTKLSPPASAKENQADAESVQKVKAKSAAAGPPSKADEPTEALSERAHPLSKRRAFQARQVAGQRDGNSKNIHYKIRPGDTLMKISFAKYGSLLRWREIWEANRTVLKDYQRIPIGAEIWIYGVRYRVISKNGEPYLIRKGDTLGGISEKVYGQRSGWYGIWKNNPELITHPDRIYAGFTLYYPKQLRGPAAASPANGAPQTR